MRLLVCKGAAYKDCSPMVAEPDEFNPRFAEKWIGRDDCASLLDLP